MKRKGCDLESWWEEQKSIKPDTTFTEDIDTGPGGMSGYYCSTFKRVERSSLRITLGVVCFSWPYFWKPELFGAVGPLLYTYALGAIALLVAWCLFPGFGINRWWNRWSALELQGVRYVLRNGHYFRVEFYRAEDGSLLHEAETREERFREELNVSRNRKHAIELRALNLIVPLVVQLVLIGALYIYPRYMMPSDAIGEIVIWFQSLNSDIPLVFEGVLFLGGWQILITLGWFSFAVAPRLTRLGIPFLENYYQRSGAQFIPGARPLDPVVPETTLETMFAEMAHGEMRFIDPQAAAQQMSS